MQFEGGPFADMLGELEKSSKEVARAQAWYGYFLKVGPEAKLEALASLVQEMMAEGLCFADLDAETQPKVVGGFVMMSFSSPSTVLDKVLGSLEACFDLELARTHKSADLMSSFRKNYFGILTALLGSIVLPAEEEAEIVEFLEDCIEKLEKKRTGLLSMLVDIVPAWDPIERFRGDLEEVSLQNPDAPFEDEEL